MRVGIIGYGDLGRQIKMYLQMQDANASFIVFDDYALPEEHIEVRAFSDFIKEDYASISFFVGLGYKLLEKKYEVYRQLIAQNRTLGRYLHPSVIIGKNSSIANGVLVYPGTIIDHQVNIHSGVLLNNNVVVCHDTSIGSATYISPSVTICGKVTIGERCFIGAGSVISNGVTIGNDTIIGIGTIVTKNIGPGSKVIGNPMRLIDKLNIF